MELRVKSVTGSALKTARDDRILSQQEAATQVGVSVRTWQLWESAEEIAAHPKHRRALLAWLAEATA